MREKELHEGWRLKILPLGTFGTEEEMKQGFRKQEAQYAMDGVVPGGVYDALIREGLLADPYWRDAEEEALSWMEHDFLYSAEFTVPEEWEKGGRFFLRFSSIDTIAWIFCNGALAGRTENMHRSYEFEVTELLKPEGNLLEVCIQSPVRYIREKQKETEVRGSTDAMEGFPHIRKAHCMFGWDWGPHLPDAGLRGRVALRQVTGARLGETRVRQLHEEGRVTLRVQPEIQMAEEGNPEEFSWRLRLRNPEGKTVWKEEYSAGILSAGVPVEKPALWWPNGLGAQPLYTVQIKLCRNGQILEEQEKRIGLRKMTVCRQKDAWGESFAHEVNGVPVFAMGADYIPEDCIYGRLSRERTRALLQDCRDAHFNCVRVWGGGWYPSEDFLDLCDEMGLMVWLDFMFACATYDLNEEFDRNIRAEIRENVRRIRHHASLALYCGNNEMEMFVSEPGWTAKPKHFADYFKMYEYIIPQIVEEEDGDTFYWPASPSSGGSLDEPNAPDRGDVHFWEVWHGNKPFSEYRKHFFRYASEFGFESFPSEKTIEAFTLPEDRNPFSYVMEKHQRCVGGNGKILTYLSKTFLYPMSMSGLVYASQLLQAEAIKYGVEHFRRNRGRCMGAIYWQLNDCWPVASWASVDYYGRWKALHYYAKRFFAPVLLSCEEESVLTQDWDLNQAEKRLEKSVRMNVSNETLRAREVTVCWQLRGGDGEARRESRKQVRVEALSACWLEKEEYPDADPRKDYVSYQLYESGELVSSGSVLFTLPKYFCFEDPKLTAEVQGDAILIRAEAYARSVEIRNENDDLRLEDNFFDMDPGVRRIRILKGSPKGIRVRSVYDIR